MAKEKQMPVTVNTEGFLLVRSEPGKETMGMNIQVPGVLLCIATDTADGSGRDVSFRFLESARIDPICIDNQITTGNLIGGNE
jgi:hypothetical protein